MDRIAFISDVHGDIEALDIALEMIAGLDCERLICSGDIVGYGAHQESVVQRFRELGILSVRGNHDRWAMTPKSSFADQFGYGKLSEESRTFLGELPIKLEFEYKYNRIAVYHGSPMGDMDFLNPENLHDEDFAEVMKMAKADILVVGHTHRPVVVSKERKGTILNPGALLRDKQHANPGGTFGVLDIGSSNYEVYSVTDRKRLVIDNFKSSLPSED